MEVMTHGDYDRGQPWPFGPADPQYPYGAPPPGYYPPHPHGYYAPGPYAPPPARGGYPPGPPQPDPGGQSRALAIWSIVFAFVFAPVGAVLGHLALSQIRRGLQHGRDLALVGLTLSYTFIVLTVAGLAMWMVTGANAGGPTVADRPDVIAVPDPAHTETPSARPAPDALTGVLLSIDELKSILKAPGLAETPSSSGESQGGDDDAKAEPAECAGAVAAGLNTVYDGSGATGYTRVGYSDPRTATLVDQVAASFASAADARDFVAQSAAQWQQCAGKSFSISTSSGPGLTWDLGTVAVEGDRATLRNTLTTRQGLPQYRILAAKGNVVIDLSVLAKELGNEPSTIADRMLARIPG
jgi:hypothetical protein